jgi:restriction system protein
MMKASTQYEHFVAEYFEKKGYACEVTPESNDYGVDIIASKDGERVAIQSKMYGDSTRKVNRKSLMELSGAKTVLNCHKAIMVTNGEVLDDAKEVAEKLSIGIIYIPFTPKPVLADPQKDDEHNSIPDDVTFETLWQNYIVPLRGKTISGVTGLSNKIIGVNNAGVTRITKNGESNKIPIEAFKWAVNRLLTKGVVTRDEINQEFVGRLSSGTILILSQVPIFTTLNNPLRIVYTKAK